MNVEQSKGTADLDEENALIESIANNQHDIDMNNSNLHMLRITAAPTTATTTTQAATTSKAKNCRGLIQKRAHTIDDFMEGNRDASACVKCVKSDHCFGTSEPRHCNLNLNAISPLTDSFKWKPQCGGLCMSQSVIRLGF